MKTRCIGAVSSALAVMPNGLPKRAADPGRLLNQHFVNHNLCSLLTSGESPSWFSLSRLIHAPLARLPSLHYTLRPQIPPSPSHAAQLSFLDPCKTFLDPYLKTMDDSTKQLFVALLERAATKLVDAAKEGDPAMVHLLLTATADGNSNLFHAVHGGHAGIVDILLAAGFDPNAEEKVGWTPLRIAASNGQRTIVTSLLKAGADKDRTTTDHGITPLYMAAQNGHGLVVEHPAWIVRFGRR